MNLQTSHVAGQRHFGMMVPAPVAEPTDFEGVVLRHLTTRSEIESVMHLREEIDLSVHASGSSEFASLEKKETSWGSSLLSSSTVNS
jgi:hypothetical protein